MWDEMFNHVLEKHVCFREKKQREVSTRRAVFQLNFMLLITIWWFPWPWGIPKFAGWFLLGNIPSRNIWWWFGGTPSWRNGNAYFVMISVPIFQHISPRGPRFCSLLAQGGDCDGSRSDGRFVPERPFPGAPVVGKFEVCFSKPRCEAWCWKMSRKKQGHFSGVNL